MRLNTQGRFFIKTRGWGWGPGNSCALVSKQGLCRKYLIRSRSFLREGRAERLD